MVNELSCWVVDWTAIGAVVTACAACVALYVGLEPRRVEQKKRGQRAAVAASFLLYELRSAAITSKNLSSDAGCLGLVGHTKLQVFAKSTLEMPLLKGCIASAETYPENVAVIMGRTYAAAWSLRAAIQLLDTGGDLDGEELARMKRMAERMLKESSVLEGEAAKYLPKPTATNRSVSNTPSDTLASMSNK